jgi:drug/metabolite transporter (DMT)-like permease
MPGVGELAGLAAAACFATTSLIMRSEARHIDVIVLNGLRTSVSAIYLLVAIAAMVWLGGSAPSLGPHAALNLALMLGSVVLAIGAGDTMFFLAMQRIGVPRAMPISMSHPLFTSILAVLFLGETINAGFVAGIVMILGGLYLVSVPARGRVVVPIADAQATRVGLAMALGAAMCWAVSTVLVRPALLEVDTVTAATLRVCAGALTIWVIAAWGGRRLARAQLTRARLGLILVSGTLSAGSMILYLLSIQEAGAARAAVLGASSPLYAVPLAALLLGEHINVRILVGMLLAVSGVVVLILT